LPNRHQGSKVIAIWDKLDRRKVIRTASIGLISGVITPVAVAILVAWNGEPAGTGIHEAGIALKWILLITCQTLCLVIPAISIVACCGAVRVRNGFSGVVSGMVNLYICALPVVVLLDGLLFHWIGQRLFTISFARVHSEFSRLVPFMGMGSFGLLGWVIAFCLVSPAMVWGLGTCLGHGVPKRGQRRFGWVLASVYTLGLCFGVYAFVSERNDLRKEMELHRSAQPFYAFGILPSPSVGPDVRIVPQQYNDAVAGDVVTLSSDVGVSVGYQERERRLRISTVIPPQQPKPLPDVVVIVIESLRAELVAEDVMPNLSAMAEEGIHCRYHFSGGNATNHGVFSLVTGLEPVWFGSSQRFDPGLYRYFKHLGYEVGFFAGANDWDSFRMGGFIRPELFDEYNVRARDGLATDRWAVEMAKAFLGSDRSAINAPGERPPRLAIVYLYATHATYQSYSKDQIDQPSADSRFPFPYPAKLRDAVWNRYRNSARTVDRLIEPLLSRERVVVATGDHGEAFLEDGTIGHGVRLSRYQNMTPAVLYCPGESVRVIAQPTSHIDVLPTILSFLNVELTDPEAIDGVSLTHASDQRLEMRRFSVRNYLGEEYGLIGPWTKNPGKPFAYRFTTSVGTETARALNGIDERGLETSSTGVDEQSVEVGRWKKRLYRSLSAPVADSR
jgi:hypothetical protein